MTTAEQASAARRLVQDWATKLGFSAIDKTKFVTAASELARNTLVHGGGGYMDLTECNVNGRIGLQAVFQDSGRGIANIDQALEDGYSTAKSLGLGLGGAKRLVNEFSIRSEVGVGTTVSITQWKRR
ncbi:anti-sigma regulatory factor [Robbsia andropogonis]|uniref:anti-sigma regulatory factor n=1 Tax=Robbsia andropogonis TaxID=28092 RepID=UPI0028C4ED9B|nr:anti-sigma regulatory factor [Robbsia andropogonis]